MSAELLRKSVSSLIVLKVSFPCERLPLRDPLSRMLLPSVSWSLLWPLALLRRRRLLDFGLLSRDTSAVALLSNKSNLAPTLSALPALAIVQIAERLATRCMPRVKA